MTTQASVDPSALFPSELTVPLPATALALIGDEGILSVAGTDATRFLQGQLSCDVVRLATGSSTLGARCNPKGRMQSSFLLYKRSEEEYLLAIHREVLEAQQQDLAKYAAFFKVTLADVSAQWTRLALWGENPEPALSIAADCGATTLQVAEQTHQLWLPADRAGEAVSRLAQHAVPVAAGNWQLQLIRLGIGQVQGPTRESFIPQMLNLQHLGGVSFSKGCYTGQEIVARMEYLGKLKRRMYRLLGTGKQLPAPGTAILDLARDQAVGEVVVAARAEDGMELLAVLQSEAAELPTLGISDTNETSLRLATLPYDSLMAAETADS